MNLVTIIIYLVLNFIFIKNTDSDWVLGIQKKKVSFVEKIFS